MQFNRIYLLFIILGFLSSPASAEWFKQQQAIMGTSVSVELWADKKSQADKCSQQVMDNMHRIDQAMSPFKPDSELSRMNTSAAANPFKATSELFQLIQAANKMSQLTQGRFDITFASVGYLYDYRKGIKPSQAQREQRVNAIDYRHIILDATSLTVHFKHPDVRIDLGGIAKGHAVDQAIAILKQCGIQHALVSAGGDSRILGDKRGQAWMTGIRHPRQKDKFIVAIPLTNTAISTSGDYERFFIQDGVRYHHILNPASGKPAKNSRSVTVLGPDTTTTDALSTAMFVMGADQALKLVHKLPGIDAIIIDKAGRIHYSEGLKPPEK